MGPSWNWNKVSNTILAKSNFLTLSVFGGSRWVKKILLIPINLSRAFSMYLQDKSNHSVEMAVIMHSYRESTKKANLHTVLNTLQMPQEPGRGAPQDDRDHKELRHHHQQWEPSRRHITPKVETQGRCTYSPFR